jgi:K+-transporting ATPase ATPase C chain
MKKNMLIALLMTVVTTLVLGIAYPLVVTAAAQLLFHDKANGSIVYRNGTAVGSRLIGQSFTGDKYFHSRPSAAGNGYDGLASGGTNLGPASQKLADGIAARVAAERAAKIAEAANVPAVPVDLVTASASGLDPDITPAAAEFQLARVARARGLSVETLRSIVAKHTFGRQLGILGEPRVNVLELNLDLDQLR